MCHDLALMRRRLVVSCVAGALLVGACGGSSDGDSASDGQSAVSSAPQPPTSSSESTDTAAPLEIGDVTVVPDDATAASATIGIEGGTVSGVDSAGTSYELVIPPGSLAAETAIVMTPADLDGVPFPTATVMFEPTGLEFIVPATLTIVPPVDIPIEDQFIYQLNDDATVFLATLPTTDDDTITMEVNHFSGYGAASTDDAGRAGLLLKGAAEAAAALESRVNEMTQRHHVAAVIGTELDEDFRTLLEAADAEYVEKVITPRIEAASSSCAANILAVDTVLGLEHRRALMSEAPPEFDVQESRRFVVRAGRTVREGGHRQMQSGEGSGASSRILAARGTVRRPARLASNHPGSNR